MSASKTHYLFAKMLPIVVNLDTELSIPLPVELGSCLGIVLEKNTLVVAEFREIGAMTPDLLPRGSGWSISSVNETRINSQQELRELFLAWGC